MSTPQNELRPQRVRLERTRGWRKPENTVVVSRPSGWGNPFKIGEPFRFVEDGELLIGVVNSHEGAVAMFRRFLAARPDLTEKVRTELAGKNLACWCSLDRECHADVLLNVAAGRAVVSDTRSTG